MPDDIVKVLIEIPEGSRSKFELDEETGEMTLDRVMPTTMGYPANYGLIHHTLGEDGDALDALVFLSGKVYPNIVIKCKVIGLLEMEDEAGIDNKVICVPASTKIDPIFGSINDISELPEPIKRKVKHFFEHYKDLEEGKWVKLRNWLPKQSGIDAIKKAREKFEQNKN